MTQRVKSEERIFSALSGWWMLAALPAAAALIVWLGVRDPAFAETPLYIVSTILGGLTLVTLAFGFFIVNPNVARVLVLFGRYRGTVRTDGFFWTNPFTIKHTLSLKAHNVASQKIKVNDLAGNPIEIGAVVVWRVSDTAQAEFDVEDYEQYLDVQIEAAIRTLASRHPYDEGQVDEITSLRGDTEEVAAELQSMLQERFERAGVVVLESRITHLAYAPEIASAMLQRQQATAIIAARQKIVEGAVGMVEQALADLGRKKIVELDDERRATLVGNLLVVLCGQAAPTPVLNTGSLYT